MSLTWQRCSACDAYFAVPPGSAGEAQCPGCGQSVTPGIKKKAALPLGPSTSSAMKFFEFDSAHEKLSEAQVVPEASICVQCGMCTYNCPMGIDVRAHAWRGKPIRDSHCLTCSECVNRCPRGGLRFERIPLFVVK